jgi:tyrosyl-tRNA synthetase
MQGFSFLDFLRDVGKNFPINVMLTKDSVKSRLERTDSGLSYTEFSYMLLQAYDFVHLAKNHDCILQIGGSDQWGNITAGIDLGRRMLSRTLFGLTCPLLTTSDGKKMGKTEKGAVWLSAKRTSPFEFYQYFINVADADVLMTLRFLSDVSQSEYAELEVQVKEKPQERAAQTRLAESLTRLVHGQSKLDSAQHATKLLKLFLSTFHAHAAPAPRLLTLTALCALLQSPPCAQAFFRCGGWVLCDVLRVTSDV